MHPLQGKVVLITGASSGIGQATAFRLAKHGSRLALAARTAKALEETARQICDRGGEALALPTDVADREQCRRAVEATVERFGRLDVLLCCAGVSMRAPFADSDLDTIERVLRVNFFGTLYSTYFAIPHLKHTQGSIAAISSLTGKRGTPFYAAYGASKFGIQGLFASLRLELAPAGVHVGVLAPGFVDTPLRDKILGPDGKVYDTPPPSPFRVRPVEQCVDHLLDLILNRKTEVLLPGFIRPLLALDELLAGRLGDRYLARKFDCQKRTSPPNQGQ